MPICHKCIYIVFIIVVLFFFYSGSALAFSLGIPFGGKILTYTPCTCGFGTALVTVSTPTPGVFLYVPLAKAYSYYFPSIGRWIIGIASSTPMPCMMGVAPYCTSIGSYKPITMFGTSM